MVVAVQVPSIFVCEVPRPGAWQVPSTRIVPAAKVESPNWQALPLLPGFIIRWVGLAASSAVMHSERVCGRLIIARIAASSAGGAPGTSIELNWTVVSHMPGWSETGLGEQANRIIIGSAGS